MNIHPPKTNMEGPKMMVWKMTFLFLLWPFLVSMLNFWGVNIFYTQYLLLSIFQKEHSGGEGNHRCVTNGFSIFRVLARDSGLGETSCCEPQ